jgi:hypothetical protein
MSYRIIVWGTGFVGKAVLRNLLGHSNFEIAAVIVNAAEKDGKDLGEILEVESTGITATRDSRAALSLDADAVAYFGPSAMHAAINMENLSAALRAGKNVVDTSMAVFHNPKLTAAEFREPIEDACREGGTTFFNGGIDPGFANDLFPMTLLGLCGRVDRVRTTEFIDAGTYPDQQSLEMLGLRQPTSRPALLEQVPGMMTSIWGGPLHMIAEGLGVEIEETVEVYRRWPAPQDTSFPLGQLKAGDCAAQRIELQGIVGGEARIFVDHLHRMFPEAAPDWPRPQMDPVHANRIEIDGSPRIRQETIFCDERSGDGNGGGCLATGMRVVNAIPAVCAAEPGIISSLDLPLIPGRGGMHKVIP